MQDLLSRNMEHGGITDVKAGLAGLSSVISWMLGYSTEIGFFLASTVSVLTVVYITQGIYLRMKEINKKS